MAKIDTAPLPTTTSKPAGLPVVPLPAAPAADDPLTFECYDPDEFFTAAQIQRLEELTTESNAARDRGETLPPAVAAGLRALIDTELRGAIARTKRYIEQRRR